MESGGNYVIGASLGNYYCKTTTMMVKSPTRLARPKSQSADVEEDVAVVAGEVAGEEEPVLQPVARLLAFKSSFQRLWGLLWWKATRTWASKPV